jgi:UDP-N-acetylglucosamine--N-acetylmuramyl-(pentapeptide) pyrophosphoryl-undecaprenol N-acetylglucosamine transferase
MATRAGIPTLIQEQNSYPGVTTRLLGKRVDEVHLTFEDSKRWFKRQDHLHVTGNPTRRGLEGVSVPDAKAYFGLAADDRPTLLVVGGSLGAHTLNEAMIAHAGELTALGYRILWQTGTADAAAAAACAAALPPSSVWARPFIDRMDYAYAACDLVVCRAGATTLAELARTGKPAILVPYPFAAANHQMENARSVQALGAAEIVEDHRIGEQLVPAIRGLIDGGRLGAMAAASRALARPDAAHVIARRVLTLAGRA